MKCIEKQWKKSRCKSKYVDNYNKCECQRKGRDCQNRFFFLKSNIQLYAVYKGHTSD